MISALVSQIREWFPDHRVLVDDVWDGGTVTNQDLNNQRYVKLRFGFGGVSTCVRLSVNYRYSDRIWYNSVDLSAPDSLDVLRYTLRDMLFSQMTP